jgi:hypothetical protein
MSFSTIKIDKADRVFSEFIRLRAKKCQNCGRRGEGEKGITGLQASHYYGRRKESVRFDEENVDVLCVGCHIELGTNNKPAYKEFKIKQLGEKGFDLLTLRANTPGKKDRKLAYLVYSQLLKKLLNEG